MNRTSVPPTVCSLALTATLALLCLQPTSEARPVTRPMPLATGASVCQADAAEEDYRYLAGLVERELWDLAVTAGNKFLGDHRRSLRVSLARYRLATALFSLDRHAEALPHWRELAGVAGFEYRLEAEFRAGECALALGQAEVASLHFAAVLAGDQTYLHAPAGFLLAEAHFQARDFGQAEAAYEQHLKAFPQAATAADARRALAWCAWEQGKAQPTVERARQFLGRHEGDPAAVEIALLLGEALLEIPDAEAALKTFRAIPNSHASADAALRGSGFALAALNRPAEAAQAFGQVLRQFPSSSFTRECRLQQGVQLVSAGQHKAAVEALAQLVSAKDAEACLWGGRAQAAQGAHELALATFDRGLAATDDEQLQGRIFVARGDALGMLGRSEEARASYAQGGSDYAIHAAAVSALNSGDIEGAERLAETLLKRGKEVGYRGPTLLVLGEARFQLGRWDAAEGAFVSALELAEDDASRSRSRSRIAWCHYRTADLAAAANGFASLAEDMPTCAESEEARRMAARALEEGGSREGAAQAWRIYLENNPGGAFSTEALI
ncbi:MAG: tetratricopeptide (TPR) repeat protein, partial [Planctomycetota bacterium]